MANGDYRLATISPCLPVNNDCGTLIGARGLGCSIEVWHVATIGNDESGDGSPANPFATVQRGIDTASTHDTVPVGPGTYTGDGDRDIDFGGKGIVLMSENGPEVTISDCHGTEKDYHRGFYFHSGENTAKVIDGFTITGGLAPLGAYSFCTNSGSGVFCDSGSSPTIQDCVITGNGATGGAGICVIDSDPVIYRCKIRNNGGCVRRGCDFGSNGAGVYCTRAHVLLYGCIIESNAVLFDVYGGHGGYGAAIYCNDSSALSIINCTVVKNRADNMWFPRSVITVTGGSSAAIDNSIISFNDGIPVQKEATGVDVTLTCSDLYGNTYGDWVEYVASQLGINGNFSLDPTLCDTGDRDPHLSIYSPCLSQYNCCSVPIGAPGVGCDEDRLCGDMDDDGEVSWDDLTFLWKYYFNFGASPTPLLVGDLNMNGLIDIADLIWLAEYLNGSAVPPCYGGPFHREAEDAAMENLKNGFR